MQNVMLDLETLGTQADCVVLAIGAVKFDVDGSPLGERFYVECDIDDQLTNGRTITGATISWWMSQSAAARQVFLGGQEKPPLFVGLEMFAEFLSDNPDVKVWGNGAEFDIAILSHAYASERMQQPWLYRNSRCYRTLKSLSLRPKRTAFLPGVPHNALDDAIDQALHAQEMLFNGSDIDNADAVAGFLISEEM